MLKQRRSQIEAILIVLFLLIIIAISPQGLTSITGKPYDDYGRCGDGTCNNIDEDKYNCPQDCEVAPEIPERPGPAYVPSTPTCDLSQQYCESLIPPKDFNSEICECQPFDYCKDIPDYETCTSEQHCQLQSQYLYQYSYITKDAPYGCCQKGKCGAGKLCSTTASRGTCRTNRAYIGGPCRIKEPNDGICKLEAEPDVCYCELKSVPETVAPAAKPEVQILVWSSEAGADVCNDIEQIPKICRGQIPNKIFVPSGSRQKWICDENCKNPQAIKPEVTEEPLLIFSSEAGADVCNDIEAVPSACRGKVPNKKFTIGRSDWYCTEECEPIMVTTAKGKPYEVTDSKRICKDDSSVHSGCRSKEIGTECGFKRGRATLKGICSEDCKCDITAKKPEAPAPKEECQDTGSNFILSNNKCVCRIFSKDELKENPLKKVCQGKGLYEYCGTGPIKRICNENCECKVTSCKDIPGTLCEPYQSCEYGGNLVILKPNIFEEKEYCCIEGVCTTPPRPEFKHIKLDKIKGWVCDIYSKDPCYNKAIGKRCDTIFQFARTCDNECKCIPVQTKPASPRKT